jgi:S1-C subfamily serine protease
LPAESRARLGLAVTNLPSGDGVLVVEVQPQSPAAHAGLHRGDIIRSVGSEPVRGSEEFVSLVTETQGKLALLVDREGRTVYLVVNG